jgi:alkaline phosphatase
VIEQLIAKSHKAGKPIRFWCSPDNAVAWETFRKLGIDIINTDQPEACTLYFQQNP